MLVNLTPHSVTIRVGEQDIVLPPSGMIARVATTATADGCVSYEGISIPVVRTQFGEIQGLPEPEAGVIYITSAIVASAAAKAGRSDVLAPDTGPTAVRNESGQITAVRQLSRP